MKKLLPIIGVVGLLFAFAGCSTESGDSGPEAPEVMDADELPATGGTEPASEDAALTLFNDALLAFSSAMEDETEMESVKTRLSARATRSDSGNIDWSGSYGGGTVNMTGSYSSSITYPDALENGTATPNTWYAISAQFGFDLSGTVENVDVSDYDYSYTISGEVEENLDADMDIDLMFDSFGDPADMRGDMSADIEYGVAFSVLRSDGVGAKFVITFAASASQGLDEEGTAVAAGTLTVYNDANNVVFTIDVDLDDLESLELPGLDDIMM